MATRIFAIVMALVFVVFAVLQYNDPDPHIWIPIYLVVALLLILAMNGKVSSGVLFGVALVFLVGAIFMWPEHWEGLALKNGMKTRFIEEGRESLGLAMCFVTLVIYGLMIRNRKRVVIS
jgi:hypothetical protein